MDEAIYPYFCEELGDILHRFYKRFLFDKMCDDDNALHEEAYRAWTLKRISRRAEKRAAKAERVAKAVAKRSALASAAAEQHTDP